jgi:hypothetical protein
MSVLKLPGGGIMPTDGAVTPRDLGPSSSAGTLEARLHRREMHR